MSTLWRELKNRVKYKPPRQDPAPFSASLFSGGYWDRGNCWVCHALSVPSVSGPRVVTACCGSCPTTVCWRTSCMGLSTGTCGSNSLKQHQLWWGYCSSAQIRQTRIAPTSNSVSSFRPFQRDVIFKVTLISESVVLCPAWTANCDTSSTSRSLSLPSHELIWAFNCSAICPCQGLVTRPECVFCVIHVMPGGEWVLSCSLVQRWIAARYTEG